MFLELNETGSVRIWSSSRYLISYWSKSDWLTGTPMPSVIVSVCISVTVTDPGGSGTVATQHKYQTDYTVGVVLLIYILSNKHGYRA